jgi:hypothetical protein
MLLSTKHRFLFVHIYKTAGISVSSALMPYAATEGQQQLDRVCNRLGLSFLYPRVIRRDSSVRDWISNVMNNVFERMTFIPGHPQPVTDPHATASEIIATIGRDRFDACYTFGFVRNPWDWQVSLYRFVRETVVGIRPVAAYARGLGRERKIHSSLESFDDYIRWRCSEDVHLQSEFLFSDSGEQLVTTIGKYETLDADFRRICRDIGIEAGLPKLNVSSQRTAYQSYYTPDTVDLVRRAFAEDVERFGYEFE